MPKSPAACKYTPLEAYLRTFPEAQYTLALTFAEIEAVLGCPLPPSAYTRETWWNNEVRGQLSHKNAWLNADWQVETADLAGQTVHFVRYREFSFDGKIIRWGGAEGPNDPEAAKSHLVGNEVLRLEIWHHPRFPAWYNALPPHTRQVVDRLSENDADLELITLAQAAPDEEWDRIQFLRVLGGGNPAPGMAGILTTFVLMDISYAVEHHQEA